MKAVVRRVQSVGRRDERLMFVCPGCAAGGPEGYEGLHMLPVIRTGKGKPDKENPSANRKPTQSKTEPSKPFWNWDGDLENPTLSPSILTQGSEGYSRCHSFLENGVFRFLEDSTHPLAGQRVPMPDLPAWAEELS